MGNINAVQLTSKGKTIEVQGTPDQIKEQKALLGAMMSRGRGYAEVDIKVIDSGTEAKVRHL